MLRVIGILSLLLILVLGFSYTQYLKLEAAGVTISTQEDVIKNKDKEYKDLKDRSEILQGMSGAVVIETRKSDDSFNSLITKINTFDCNPKREVKSNANISENSNSVIADYYNVLHSAYRLQNEN